MRVTVVAKCTAIERVLIYIEFRTSNSCYVILILFMIKFYNQITNNDLRLIFMQ